MTKCKLLKSQCLARKNITDLNSIRQKSEHERMIEENRKLFSLGKNIHDLVVTTLFRKHHKTK